MKLCLIENCTKPSYRRGICSPHYAFHRYHGTLETIVPKQYRHWLSEVNPTEQTATCSVCGPTQILSNGKNRNGTPRFYCDAKARKTAYVYSFGDGETIPVDESTEARAKLYKEQDGCCAVCGRSAEEVGTLRLDHCHATGKIRGLLCNGCNMGLGMFRDSPEALIAASEYLTR